MRSFALSRVYGLLETGPVVLLTTEGKDCRNIMTMSWHTMLEFEPPLVGCVVSSGDYTFHILNETRECVIAIPTAELSEKVVKVGNTSGRDMDKFKTFSIGTARASLVKAPLLPDCYANLECKVIDISLVDKYNFFVLEVVKAWITPGVKYPKTIHHLGKGYFMVAGDVIKLPSKMR